MHSRCVQALDKLSKSFVQVWSLCAVSTGRFLLSVFGTVLYHQDSPGYSHISGSFAQPKNSVFNLLCASLYPFSTGPITNTKLI
jgi:hypothetical protein